MKTLELSVSSELDLVSSQVTSSSRWSGLVILITLGVLETSGLDTGGSQTSELSVLLVANPVDLRIVSDSGVGWVDQDHLEELVSGVLSNPV